VNARRGAQRLSAVLGLAVSNRVPVRCSVTVATSAFILGTSGAPETTRSCRAIAAPANDKVRSTCPITEKWTMSTARLLMWALKKTISWRHR
jgi:hypothetical protein